MSFIFCYSRHTASKAYWQCISMLKSPSAEEVCSHSLPAPLLPVTVTGLLANHQKKIMAQRGSDAEWQGRNSVGTMHSDLCNLAAASLSGLTKLQVVIYVPQLQRTPYSVSIL